MVEYWPKLRSVNAKKEGHHLVALRVPRAGFEPALY